MAPFVSPADAEDPWDAFFRSPALSFQHNETLREMFAAVLDPGQKVTLFVGAGVSLDAGFPSWHRLIDNMASTIDKRWMQPVKRDTSDPMRKAEYVVNMVREDTNRTEGDIVREALYPAKKAQGAVGPLAEAVANLSVVLDGRARIVTTNYDVLVEDRLRERDRAAAVHNYSLDELEAWSAASQTTASRRRDPAADLSGVPESGAHHVLHLHGILEPNEDVRGPLILTESSFLEHGSAVRRVVRQLLVDSCVIFIGVSLTDPNLIGPLWDLKNDRVTYQRPYVFQVAAPDQDGSDVDDSKAYAIKRALYLSKELGVGPIFLKSYSQLPQSLHELAFAVVKGDAYLAETSTIRYGHRLQQALETSYAAAGCGSDTDVPFGAAAAQLSDRLHTHLYGPKGLVDELGQFTEQIRTSNDAGVRQFYADHGAGLAQERFALFLWLRSRRASGHAAEYHLNLVGSSAYVHREPWSLDRTADIVPFSRHPIARAAFSGLAHWSDVDDSRQWQLWRGMVAVPFTSHGLVDDVESYGKKLDLLTLGGITLNTTHRVRRVGDGGGAQSILAAFRVAQLPDLHKRLAEIAEAVTTPSGTATP